MFDTLVIDLKDLGGKVDITINVIEETINYPVHKHLHNQFTNVINSEINSAHIKFNIIATNEWCVYQ